MMAVLRILILMGAEVLFLHLRFATDMPGPQSDQEPKTNTEIAAMPPAGCTRRTVGIRAKP